MKNIYKAKIAELDLQIDMLQNERANQVRAYVNSIAAFKIGDIIRYGYSQPPKHRGRIVEIGAGWSDEPKYIVVTLRKDGKDGMRRAVRGYENPVKE